MSYPGSQPHDDNSTFDPVDTSPNHYLSATSQQPPTQQTLYTTPSQDTPQSWPPTYSDQSLLPPFQSQPLPYHGFPPAPFPAPRLSSPHSPGGGHSATNSSRFSLAGSLDPATGIFYRTPEHPRLRTAQACEKCRTRKAKCSGEHPCKRCIGRGLTCEYAKEGRVRGPNKTKNATGVSSVPSSMTAGASSAGADLEQRGRTSSANGSVSSIEHGSSSSSYGDRSKTQELIHSEENSPVSPSFSRSGPFHQIHSPSRATFTPMSQQPSPSASSLSQELYVMSSTSSPGQPSSRSPLAGTSLGLGEHRASRPRPSNIMLDPSGQWPQEVMDIAHAQMVWMDQSGIGADSIVESGQNIGYQGQQQRQYRRQRLAQESQHQHQNIFRDQNDPLLQQHHLPQQPRDVQGGLHYPYQMRGIHPSPSLGILSPQQQQQQRHHMGSSIDMYQTQYQAYTHTHYAQQGGVEHHHGVHSPHSQTFQDQISSAMGQQGDYQGVAIRASEQGLHPSLSRIERGNEAPSVGGPGEEDPAANRSPLGGMGGTGGVGGDMDQTRWT